jgi:hypothetical protein
VLPGGCGALRGTEARSAAAPRLRYPLVRDLAAEGIGVRLTCGAIGHSTQAYYRWLASPVSQRDLDDAYFTNLLIDAYDDDPELGDRLLADELAKLGLAVGERRVWRLCPQQKLWSATVRKGRPGSGARHPGRPFTTTSCSATSPRRSRTGSGSATSPSTRPARASSTTA